MFKVYTLTDGMIDDLIATHNEADAYTYLNALCDDYDVPRPPHETTILMVEDRPHVPSDVVGSDAVVVAEYTIRAGR